MFLFLRAAVCKYREFAVKTEISKYFIFSQKEPFGTVAHNCHGKTKNLTAKTKYLTAKPKTIRQKQNTSRQNQKPYGKTKDLTAKPNTSQQKPNISRQKQIPTAKPKLFCFCCEVFGQLFGFAVKYLVLPWGFWFCHEVFFAVRLLVLPWCFCFCREVFGFAVTVVGHHTIMIDGSEKRNWEGGF